MSTLLKTLGYITGYVSVSYLTLTSMMQDPNKPYRGHLNIRTDDMSTKNINITTKTSGAEQSRRDDYHQCQELYSIYKDKKL